MNYGFRLLLVLLIIVSFFQVSAYPVPFGIPGILGEMSFSSGSGISSGISFTKSTTILPSQSTPTASPTPSSSSDELTPSHWIVGAREGNYLDPVLNTNWVYDKVLKKFYSPTNGWFLVTQYSADGKPYAQFYYDPKIALFIDMTTGKTILPGQGTAAAPTTAPTQITQQVQTTQATQQPTQKVQSTNNTIPTTVPTQVILETTTTTPSAEPTQERTKTPTEEPTEVTIQANPCEIACPDCTTGVCDDCNKNGKCDVEETGTKPTEEPEEQVTSVPATSEPTVKPPAGDGGISEDAQSTIYYYEADVDSGIVAVISCESGDTCDYCLDTDKDNTCTTKDCSIIPAETGEERKYCVDCDRDGSCDSNKIFITNCTDISDCTSAEYCIDENMDKKCDRESLP